MTQGKKSCGTGGSFKIIHKRNIDGNIISGIKEMKFGDIFDLIVSQKLKTPDFQRVIDESIVEDTIKTYKMDSSLIKEVGYIFLCTLNNETFVIDGQHRIEMIKKLIDEDNNKRNDTIAVNLKLCENIDELNNLYNVLNKNKTKIGIPTEIRKTLEGKIYENLKLILKNNYKEYFSSSSTNKYKYFISDFIEELIDNNIISKKKIKNEKKLLNIIIKKNQKLTNYYDKFTSKELDNLFYKSEITCIENKIYFTIKRSNFIKYMVNDVSYVHNPKHIKEKIPKKLKHDVWKNFTNKTEIECPIKKCTNKISFDDFHVGHIISEHNGGKLEISNLKPICSTCNLKMSFKNWSEFDK